MKKGILITDVPFWYRSAGHCERISGLILFFSKCTKLTVVYIGVISPVDEERLTFFSKTDFIFLDKKTRLKSEAYGKKLQEELVNFKLDFCIIEYVHNAVFLHYLHPRIKTFLDIHDLLHERTSSFKKFKLTSPFSEITAKMEIEIFKLFDRLILLSDADFEQLKHKIPEEKLLIASPSLSFMKKKCPLQVNNIGFLGSEYEPTVDAISYFIDSYWEPLIQKYDLKLLIYGNVCGKLEKYSQNQNIELRGFLNEEKEIFKEIDILVNPVRFGAGIKIKNIQSLANSTPVVTSSHGARGIEKGINSAFLVADDRDTFVSSAGRLIKDYEFRKELADHGYHFATQYFSESVCYARLLREIESENTGD